MLPTSKTSAPKRLPGTGLIDHDPWLEPYAEALHRRYQNYQSALAQIRRERGSLDAFSRGHGFFGFDRGTREGRPGLWYREWAPGAHSLSLIGDFNGWSRQAHPMARSPDGAGVWSIFLPDGAPGGQPAHGSHVKVHVVAANGALDRLPAYCRRAVQDRNTLLFCAQHWDPPEPYHWGHVAPTLRRGLRVYEAHVGMALEAERIGTYLEFAEQIIPRIAAAGYNAVQLMAVQEHPYYASFGYHVSNFYAASSRFGTPEELKHLVDAAHGHGLLVLLDLVHSHSVKNVHDGLNLFDGTDHQYFHGGRRGQHPAWDSLLFDYSKPEVQCFLLSNLRFWLEEYRFDGFRFDGVTSMMYLHHGLGKPFTCYDDYLIHDLDEPAITYLQLANHLAHEINPAAITVAEDVSGMVGLCRPLEEGGLGFDYRLAMGLPDYWVRLLREKRDEQWHMGEMYSTLTNRRRSEKHIAYAESHDQALVGDKSIAFWLMDADMYWHMHAGSRNPVIDRGVALHKMIRLVTFALGGEGYLNFMGNEFGHPEWVDFPRAGNNNSYKHARRQWSLCAHPDLRYSFLAAFDRAMQQFDERFDVLRETAFEQLNLDEKAKVLVFYRGPLLFLFNFHASESQVDYRFGVPQAADYQVVLNTDDPAFGGFGRVPPAQAYPWQNRPSHGREQSIQVYIPARTAQVLGPRQ